MSDVTYHNSSDTCNRYFEPVLIAVRLTCTEALIWLATTTLGLALAGCTMDALLTGPDEAGEHLHMVLILRFFTNDDLGLVLLQVDVPSLRDGRAT